ncbi:hypothetical protein BUALT_Bualt02G0243900 [Buddleja alternifolia]|uniref:WRKY transcription factor n=1 Tax=Buddleja alternifolia TaxID=168488 RepID=A0AAV6YE04_9LAMI|nr:hypothetical protein BUALT_Bualt02G0243900 [Buddleja alternifolia]
MERKDCLKMGDSFPSSSSSLLDYYPVMSNSTLTGLFDFCGEGEKNGSLGFMELLNMPQDFSSSSSVFDFDASQSVEPFMTSKPQVQESSEVLNAPATPNYSSISSESSGGQNDIEHSTKDEDDEEEEEEEHQKTNKHLKPKKTSGQKKKEREPRFAFMTKSEVDHLEDGFRWRKYGQKAVKNSPFPRSYYRCTTASCNVKKRVERSSNDPSTVVTTYEGQHTHPSPGMLRSGPAATTLPPYSGGGGSFPAPGQMLLSPHDQTHFDFSIPLSCGYNMGYYTNVMNSGAGAPQHLRFRNPNSSALLTDYGLLQDIVPSSIIKKEE